MENNIIPDIEKQISDLLNKEKKDYLTATQIRNGLPASALKHFRLTKKSGTADVLKKLRPYFGNSLQEYQGPKYKYVGYKMPLEKIILKKIRENPGMSSFKLKNSVPVINRIFVEHLHNLIKAGTIVLTLREKDHVPLLKVTDEDKKTSEIIEETLDDQAAFKAAYDFVSKGRRLVYIHQVRKQLNWPHYHFDRVLADLRKECVIELHGGDPSVMDEKEIQDSFMDEKGMLYISVSWRSK